MEELVSFELAKLAKGNGFDLDCLYHYTPGYEKALENSVVGKNNVATHHLYANNYDFEINRWGGGNKDSIAAPTQSQLQKYFIEQHNIDVVSIPVRFTGHEDIAYWTYAVKSIQPVGKELYKFDTYEKALEVGLMNGFDELKNIKY